ncbi:NUDIX hydrolase [Candidatus Dojkabacteria bacterium]|uniref:NUDIX hydrolase n=1 Tax=Candidatus Dojkabacteria bacterium TaxID=2099670 RepID=A0A955L9R2_9BACT|nr:NUDIX hydrolase [Candidatus Dojkabacteria bacterium]
MHYHQDEMLDLVNEQDEIIGVIKRSEANTSHILRFVVVNVIDYSNKILVGLKHNRKKENIWSIVGSGHIRSGEEPHEGAKRELYEESEIQAETLVFFYRKFVVDQRGKGFVYFYNLHIDSKNIELPKNNEEFCKYKWIDMEITEDLSNTAKRSIEILSSS